MASPRAANQCAMVESLIQLRREQYSFLNARHSFQQLVKGGLCGKTRNVFASGLLGVERADPV